MRLAILLLGVLAYLVLPAFLSGRSVARVSAAPTFYLPWKAGQSMLTLQGQDQGSHTTYTSRYAYDFAPDPVEEKIFVVRAARAGRVAEVVQEFGESPDCALGYNRQANYVVLDHGDGLGSLYLHLAEDSVIPPLGARVEQGDPLALTAHNGYICGPAHLHFTVLDMATRESLDIPFSDPGTLIHGGRPRMDQWYTSGNEPGNYTITLPYVPRRSWGVPQPPVLRHAP